MSGAEPLCAEERETISRELHLNRSARSIGELLGRHHSTISSEIKRNGGAANYRAVAAQERYEQEKARPKERKLVTSTRLHDAVNEGLREKWSPEQISARLDAEYPDDPEMKVSRETIYQTLYLQAIKHCTCRHGASCAPSSRSRYARAGRSGCPGPGRL